MKNICLARMRGIALSLIIMILTACTVGEKEPLTVTPFSPSPTHKSTVVLSPISSARPIIIQRPTQTLVPTATPTVAATPTPTATTPDLVPTSNYIPKTPLPTLSAPDSADLLLDLLQNNAGCRLPCWWGATPGQTQWREVDALLTSMNAEYYEANSQSHDIFLPHVPEGVSIEHPRGFHLFYGTQQDIVQGIDVESAPTSNYFLASILSEYGPPEEVLIQTMDRPREGFLPFRLVLIYWEQGFAVRLFDDAEVIDSMVTACFPANGQQNPSLFLWAVDNYTFSTPELLEGSGFAGFGEGDYYLPLEDVTDLDINSFYETYNRAFAQKNGQKPN